ncbi:MAG: pilin [Candidatus Gribaldobacteria bacterium]|nr:pilin [Candidatus Gribaldobacteria bacterium]
MQLFKKNVFGFIAILIFLGLAGVAVAQIGLEGDYPDVVNISITKASPLGEMIKYFVGWALIAAGVVAFLSLIGAGFLYLTAAGDTGRMTMARSRIVNSAIGVVILFSSFIVFKVIDPKINIVNIETKPVASGIFLFKAGDNYTKFLAGEISIGAMVKLNEAYYVTNDIPDMNKIFGDFKLISGTTQAVSGSDKVTIIYDDQAVLDFKSFPLGGIGFWGDYGQRTKVVLYDQLNFESTDKSEPKEYLYNSSGIGTKMVGEIKVIDLTATVLVDPYFGFFKTIPSPGKDIKCSANNNDKEISIIGCNTKEIKHPPLSLALHGNGPGVYLYSAKDDKDWKKGVKNEKYFMASVPDFGADSVKFNDDARFIAIKNKFDTETIDSHDYLAILHENANYSGQLKIFFQGKDHPHDDWVCDATCMEKGEMTGSQPTKKIVSGLDFKTPRSFNVYGKSEGSKPFWLYSQFGKVEKPSSLQIFELSPNYADCNRVKLCTEKNFTGYCIVYDSDVTTGDKGDKSVLARGWIPSFIPEDIYYQNIEVKELDSDGKEVTKKINFENNIRSIEIEGNCAVVLFENPIVKNGTSEKILAAGLRILHNTVNWKDAFLDLIKGTKDIINNWKKAFSSNPSDDSAIEAIDIPLAWENDSPGSQSGLADKYSSFLRRERVCSLCRREF